MLRENTRSRFILGLLLLVSAVLIVLDSRSDGNPVIGTARTAGQMAFAPISTAVSTLTAPITDAYRALAAAPGASERIEELQARNTELTRELAARDRERERSDDLADLLRLASLGDYEIVPAQAVTRLTVQGYADTVTLDVGRRDGVDTEMTVLNGDGLVGRVTEAGETTSTVRLVTDGSSSVGARLAGSKEIGVVSGGAQAVGTSAPMRFELLDATATVEKGEQILSLGSHDNAPYVPGVPIGAVSEVHDTPGALSRTADVEPVVDFSRLDVVGVVVAAPESDPRDSVPPSVPGPDDRAEDAARDGADQEAAADQEADREADQGTGQEPEQGTGGEGTGAADEPGTGVDTDEPPGGTGDGSGAGDTGPLGRENEEEPS
ncbi:rod shape-determining protein MreC [Spinactinospora alkalitolerans]|uniref:Cell shape-determining protein MreC n=1 Tax=Spinactinospora alkalitolerans TaxID=687207 RepID=A0A852TQV1_9ACTN|nr:rod shape-determining protein MreC [Spinactinospora alkalitolerans]NYE46359.1 rod shape-determining protein MreC [Spinactinospora alkalitolerans]